MARILVIDDDGLFRDIVRIALEGAGHVVVQAEDGIKGAEAFRTGGADLVIVDMYMPGQDGIETIFELDAGSRNVPVIAVSGGHPMGGDSLRMAENAGATLTLEKGFAPEELVEAVRGLLEGRAAR
jgi:two-component system chemotaxis response regulator CheY